MNEIVAVEYFESLIKRFEDKPDETYWGKAHNATSRDAISTALAALREQAERSSGCVWCKALSFNPDIGGCRLVFFKSKEHPKGEHAISVSVFDEYGEEQEPVLVQIDNCIRCGKRLEVERDG